MFLMRSVPLLLFLGAQVLVSLLPAAGLAQETDARLREHFDAAQRDQQNSLLDAAAGEYREVLRLQPDLPEAWVNLGLVYYAQSKFEDSARALAAAAKLRPGMRGVSLWLGIDDVKLDRPAQAVALLREAAALDPADKQAQSWLGTALWNAGHTDASLHQLRKTARQFVDDPDLLLACGEAYAKAANQEIEKLLDASAGTALSDLIYANIYAEEHSWIKATGHLHRAIARDPRLLDARLELAEVLFEQAKLPEALEELDQARTLAPHSAAVLARSGEILLLLHPPEEGLSRIALALATDSSEAIDALGLPAASSVARTETAAGLLPLCNHAVRNLEASPDSGSAKDAALAALYKLSGDSEASMRAYRAFRGDSVKAHPSPVLWAQALTAFHEHRDEDAEALLQRWLAANPADRMAHYDLALVRRRISMAQLERLLTVAPDSWQLHEMLGQLYARQEEDEKALTEYRAVAAARPNLPGVHFWLGHLYWKHGYADDARRELTRELELTPGHPEANGELGAVLVALDRAQEAIPHLVAAIRSKPDLWPAYPQLGRAYAMEKDYARAEAVLKQGLAHDHDAAAHYQLALVLRAEGKTAEAAKAFAQVRAIKIEKMAAPPAQPGAEEGAKR